MTPAGCTITVGGTVQGVGFRPFAYRTAVRLGVAGTVRNGTEGVVIRAQGERGALDAFVRELHDNPPPLAEITSFSVAEAPWDPGFASFFILASTLGENPTVDITRDSATCDACLREMRDPSDRRFGHPFINCTDCGPRFTIIKALPYDRKATTMQRFRMCSNCAAEYRDPASRRFHAQPVCCPSCGPRLTLLDRHGAAVSSGDPLRLAVERLAAGGILAIKGLGGFHLACRADSEDAVAALRQRKHREEKPLAIMVADTEAARRYASVSEAERKLLESVDRPIVILEKKPALEGIAPSVAPRVPTLGIMLPYTPLHHLLFDTDRYRALVMTSANLSNETLCRENDEALRRLDGIADAFLVHDRPIHVPIDDSVARELGGSAVLLRRARGYVPAPLSARSDVQGIVGLGGIMKSTVAVGRGSTCYVSHYLGSADTVETVEHSSRILDHLLAILGVDPVLAVMDMHPAGPGASALVRAGLPVLKVQHHHAHAAACLAENGIEKPAVCIVYDGLGLGDDGNLWGGEVLIADTGSYARVGHLENMPMPGADMAVRYPGRMAMGALYPLLGERVADDCPWMPPLEREAMVAMLSGDVNCPKTSSMGRLFDALSALLGVCTRQTYEGQPAIELEGAADGNERGAYEAPVERRGGIAIMDGRRVLKSAWDDYRGGTPVPTVAGRFHNTVIAMTVETAALAAEEARTGTVCLSGGCFQNKLLRQGIVAGLRRKGLQPVCHRILPPSDESVAFGQVVVAGRRRQTEVL